MHGLILRNSFSLSIQSDAEKPDKYQRNPTIQSKNSINDNLAESEVWREMITNLICVSSLCHLVDLVFVITNAKWLRPHTTNIFSLCFHTVCDQETDLTFARSPAH